MRWGVGDYRKRQFRLLVCIIIISKVSYGVKPLTFGILQPMVDLACPSRMHARVSQELSLLSASRAGFHSPRCAPYYRVSLCVDARTVPKLYYPEVDLTLNHSIRRSRTPPSRISVSKYGRLFLLELVSLPKLTQNPD